MRLQVLIVDEADELIDSTGEGTAGKTMLELRDVLLRANPRIQFVLLSATFKYVRTLLQRARSSWKHIFFVEHGPFFLFFLWVPLVRA